MLTTKKLNTVRAFVVLLGVWLSACRPSGPDALLQGERLLHEQKYGEAIEQLMVATRLLPENAQAWNHLGLAYHGAGNFAQAAQAYRQALQRDPNLVVVYFNSGLLALEQNDVSTAITNLTKFIVWKRDSAQGWLKLGAAQLRAGQSDAAEKSFQAALKLHPGQAEALNGLGVIQTQKRRPREAISYFTNALQAQPNYGPAMLNVAVVTHSSDSRNAALWYKDYLAAHPTAPNAGAVREIVRHLDSILAPAQKPVTVTPPPPTNPPPTARISSNARPALAATNVLHEPGTQPRTQPVANAELLTSQAESPNRSTIKSREPQLEPQEVRVATDVPVTRAVIDVSAQPSVPTNAAPKSVKLETATPASVAEQDHVVSPEPRLPAPEQKRSLADRLNPVNWFTRSKPAPTTTPLDSSSRRAVQKAPENTNDAARTLPPQPASLPTTTQKMEVAAPRSLSWPRYAYRSPATPASGDRPRALDAVARGVEAHRQRKLTDALEAYREATRVDPSFFEAQYNLGLAAYELKNWPLSLSAYETALSINPTSPDARFNFATSLDRAGYPLDAAEQLEKLISQQPNDARAHFSFARLNAEELNRPNVAIRHYQKVLELEPQHPQASTIRQWLLAQPLR